ncbi:MAG: P1 family peptidase [Hyphomonadaceae bacterium]
MAAPGPLNALTDVAGLLTGCAEDARVRTGVTVIVAERPAVCAADLRGGGPGTRETDALEPHTLVDAVDAIVLAGGSVYGLGAADAVTAELGARGRGFQVRAGLPPAPIVPAAILFDLANGGDKNWGASPPYAALARAALAKAGRTAALGAAGAGFGATAGALQGGQGEASIVTGDGVTVAALACVNSLGSVLIPDSRVFWAWPFEIGGEFGGMRPDPAAPALDPENWGAAKAAFDGRANTTLAVVATDAALTPAEAKRVAQMAGAGMARAIRPIFTPSDGDIVFALATGARAAAGPRPLAVARIGALAADCLARAIARGVYAAHAVGTRPAWRDLPASSP